MDASGMGSSGATRKADVAFASPESISRGPPSLWEAISLRTFSTPLDAASVATTSTSLASSAASFAPSRCAAACSSNSSNSDASCCVRSACAPPSRFASGEAAGRLRSCACARVWSILSFRDVNGIAPSRASKVSFALGTVDGGAAPRASTVFDAAARARLPSSNARRKTKSATLNATLASSLSFSIVFPCTRSSCSFTPRTKLRASRASASTSLRTCDFRPLGSLAAAASLTPSSISSSSASSASYNA
mmetsp:Transcript_23197/g.59171  ORF Transcript_23197/g.59171 Transcript_23197/m.59171 type:complete len:249 (-) Transcript_23197:391-1137(-)